jgi:predicted O-methyltransferase YrrM
MSLKPLILTQELYQYLLQNGIHEPAVLAELRTATQEHEATGAHMLIAPEQGQFLAFLIKLLQPKRLLDIGTFTGYSAINAALAAGPSARIISCDICERSVKIARKFSSLAGVEQQIEFKIGRALDTQAECLAQGEAGNFDFIFIDADKRNNDAYYERSLQLLRPGGLIAIDNTLWDGRVADSMHQEKDTQAIRALNEKIHNDPRVDAILVTIGDGMWLIRA